MSAKYAEAQDIINNWRSAHSYPLNIMQNNLRRASKRFDDSAVIAQRIKRLSSIKLKLQLHENMKLSQMQDIGGCRAIVRSVGLVRQISGLYESSRIRHELVDIDDYISEPRKDTGYRSLHLIYKYISDYESRAIFDGLRIEMQLRSRYQHAWATAVETVSIITKQALKSNIGDDDWLYFFKLMSSAIALRERCPTIDGTPTSKSALIKELHHYASDLNVANRLVAYSRALTLPDDPTFSGSGFYLLELVPDRQIIYVSSYRHTELNYATEEYRRAEERAQSAVGRDAVLVSAESLGSIKKAFPNYFADTRVFVELLDQAIAGTTRKIEF